MPDHAGTTAPTAGEADEISASWRNSLFGLGTALCFAISPVFIRVGLAYLPSPLLGVTSGIVMTTAIYAIVLLIRWRRPVPQGAISWDAIFFMTLAGASVGLGTWARWVALDMISVAVVIALGRLNVPIVLLLAPLLVGRQQERVTARLWLGAGLIIAGSAILNFYS